MEEPDARSPEDAQFDPEKEKPPRAKARKRASLVRNLGDQDSLRRSSRRLTVAWPMWAKLGLRSGRYGTLEQKEFEPSIEEAPRFLTALGSPRETKLAVFSPRRRTRDSVRNLEFGPRGLTYPLKSHIQHHLRRNSLDFPQSAPGSTPIHLRHFSRKFEWSIDPEEVQSVPLRAESRRVPNPRVVHGEDRE